MGIGRNGLLGKPVHLLVKVELKVAPGHVRSLHPCHLEQTVLGMLLRLEVAMTM